MMGERSKTLKDKALKRDDFICQKCKLKDKTGIKLEAHHIIPLYLGGKDDLDNLITLCFDCHHYAPDNPEEFKEYIGEEIEGTLTTLIKAWKLVGEEHPELVKEINSAKMNKTNEEILKKENQELRKENESLKNQLENFSFQKENQKSEMVKKASQGNSMSRPPFGYEIIEGKLIPGKDSYLVEEIFQDFLNNKISLTQLAKKYSFSVNGLKKILRNFTYIGKIKFSGQAYQGSHQPLLSSTLFNHVQDKLEKLGIKV